MAKTRTIELLAPAKNLICAREAILHGADAVYIGAPKFGARSSAGNSLDDLKELVAFAHPFGVRIYVTLNTLLFEEELEEVEKLIWDLWNIGVDALIVQDMGITRLNLPPISLHASTQTDNRTPEKVRFLEEVGFKQVVLARELSLEQIKAISSETTVPLECFVHGALCVSYSGQCYISEAIGGRSANRGECAQFCRLPYDLIDADGNVLVRQKHLLSIKDLNRSEALEELIDAGIRSFKIEGRLKEVSYVKNITAFYREKLDEVLRRRPDLVRSSEGVTTLTFKPEPYKSFNRGFTDYFLKGRPQNLGNPDTPKSMGEPIGRVKDVRGNHLTVAGVSKFANGDGLSFVGANGQWEGFRVNRVEENRLYPPRMPELHPNTLLYRTHNQEFESLLEKPSAERHLPVFIRCWETSFGFGLSMEDESGHRAALSFVQEKIPASKPQEQHVIQQLSKLGATLFVAVNCELDWQNDWFVPVSVWSEQRRLLCERFAAVRAIAYRRENGTLPESPCLYPETKLSYLGNVLNSKADEFYRLHGVDEIEPAFESANHVRQSDQVLMFNKHCIKFELGACPRVHRSNRSFQEPLFLAYQSKRIQLHFDCKACEMRLTEAI